MSDVTQILNRIDQGDPHAAEQLLPLIYDELRRLATQRLALNEALDALHSAFPRRAKLVKFRYFAGLTLSEVAAMLGIAQSTAEADWTYSKAWLKREIEKS